MSGLHFSGLTFDWIKNSLFYWVTSEAGHQKFNSPHHHGNEENFVKFHKQVHSSASPVIFFPHVHFFLLNLWFHSQRNVMQIQTGTYLNRFENFKYFKLFYSSKIRLFQCKETLSNSHTCYRTKHRKLEFNSESEILTHKCLFCLVLSYSP